MPQQGRPGPRGLIAKSPLLRKLVWPSAVQALRRRRDGAIALNAIFRSLLGRDPDEAEQAQLLDRAKHGLDFDALVDELLSGSEGLERIRRRWSALVRGELERHLHPGTADSPAPGPRVVFLHIMKVGGTSLSEMLSTWVDPARSMVAVPLDDIVVMPKPQLAGLSLITGHIPFETLALIPGGFSTVCALRDPFERTISHYQELRRTGNSHGDLSLDQFLSDEAYSVPSGNYQARQLAHTIGLGGAWLEYSPMVRYVEAGGSPTYPYPLQALFDSTPLTLDDNDLFASALRNLTTIDFVSVTEGLDDLARRLAAFFDLTSPRLPRRNVSAPFDRSSLTTALRRRVDARTAVDRELYERATWMSKQTEGV